MCVQGLEGLMVIVTQTESEGVVHCCRADRGQIAVQTFSFLVSFYFCQSCLVQDLNCSNVLCCSFTMYIQQELQECCLLFI